ncbi:hypothetical protein ACRAWF_30925 [Streptomyces sp. L7]
MGDADVLVAYAQVSTVVGRVRCASATAGTSRTTTSRAWRGRKTRPRPLRRRATARARSTGPRRRTRRPSPAPRTAHSPNSAPRTPACPSPKPECRALEPLAAEWLTRGATPADMVRALTDGLPPTITNPGGLARNRLETKMPPKKNDAAGTRPLRARVTRVLMACATCDADERTAKIISGICEECRAEPDLERGGDQEGVRGDRLPREPRRPAS